jgi:hypothetical protein
MIQRRTPISAISLSAVKKLPGPRKKICRHPRFFAILKVMQSPPAPAGLAGKPLFKNNRNMAMT